MIDRAKKADSTKLTAVELKEIIQPSFASVHEPSDMIFYKLHMLFSFQEDCLVSTIQILDLVSLLLHRSVTGQFVHIHFFGLRAGCTMNSNPIGMQSCTGLMWWCSQMITSYGDQLPRTQLMKLHFKTGLVQRQRISFLMKRLPLHDRKELCCQENVVTQLEWFDVNVF